MQNTVIAQPSTKEQLDALKAFLTALKIDFSFAKEKEEESPYNPEFVAKILKSQEDFKNGKGKSFTIEELEALWK